MQLTAVPNLHVLLPASMRQESIDTLEKARAEGATLALEGTFHFQGDQVMLEYSWTRTADGKPLRAKSVKGSWADRITYQEDVVRAVLAELQAELAPGPGFGTSSQKAASLFVEGLGALSEYHDPKNVDTAVERFKEAVRLDPKYAAAQAALGQAYWHKYGATQDRSFLEASLAACQLANDLAPENSDAQVCLGRVYQARGDHPLAIEKYKLAIQYSAANDNAFLSLGKVLEEDGRFGEAEKEYQRAIDLRPDYWAPQSWIAGFYCAQQKYIEALEHYKAALDLSPSNAQVLYSMACPFAALGQYEMAVNVLEESAKLRPWKIPYSNLGVVYLRWRHYENALTQLEKAVELATKDGGDYRITGSLARVYSLTGKKDKAREMYELAIKQGNRKLEVNPVDDEVQILLGRYYAMLQKRTEAESALDVALKRKPDDPHYLLIAATAYVALNERQRALAYMKRAVEHNYGSVQISAEPELDVLKEEPKFKELMSSVAPSR